MSDADIERWDVVVVGAGAAGLMAAAQAAHRGRRTLLLEKNRKPGVKILMSGGTRCNLTHATDAAGIIAEFGRPGRFLHSALAALGPADVVQLFAAEGVADVRRARGQGVSRQRSGAGRPAGAAPAAGSFRRQSATGRARPGDRSCGRAVSADHAAAQLLAERIVVTTGGRSYPGCGTTGDAYAWLAELGHTIVPPRPALVPLTSPAAWVSELQGIAFVDVLVRVVPRAAVQNVADPAERLAQCRRRQLAERRGALLLTHFGLSGPAPMDVSRVVTAQADPAGLDVVCDLLPDLAFEQLDESIRRAGCRSRQPRLVNVLPGELPQRLAETIVTLCGLPRELAGRGARQAAAAGGWRGRSRDWPSR